MIKPLFERIVVAYNGSVSSLHAAMYAIIMAKQYECNVKIIYVVDTAAIKQLTLSKFMVQSEGIIIKEHLENDGKRNLEFIEKLAKSKGIAIETELRSGAIWSEIVTAADDYKADIILLGGAAESTKSSLLKQNHLSSSNNEIIASAHCSVMVVRQPYIEQLFKHL